MENNSNLKWHQRPLGIIFMLVIFWPVGIHLMWKNEIWSKQIRSIVTGAFIVCFAIYLVQKNFPSDSAKLNPSLVGLYTQHESLDGRRNTLEINEDGSFIYHGFSTGFAGGTSIKEHYVKGKFKFGKLKINTTEGFTDEYSQSIIGFEYSPDHKENDGNLLFNQIHWGPEYVTSIGYTRREATGNSPKKSLLLVTEYGIAPLFVKNGQ